MPAVQPPSSNRYSEGAPRAPTIGSVIRDAIDEGSFARRDPRLATLALLGALNWTVKWYREGGGKGAAQVGEEFADLFLSGLESRSRE